MRILLLNYSDFPQKFEDIEINPLGCNKTNYIEQKIIKAINDSNPKIDLHSIEYTDINATFNLQNNFNGKYSGLIVEESTSLTAVKRSPLANDTITFNRNNQFVTWKIYAYVFLSPAQEKARNILVSQAIFPELFRYMEKYLSSPSYTIANHPIYFLNIINKHITADMLIKHFTGLRFMGIEYIGVFDNFAEDLPKPTNLESYLRRFYAKSILCVDHDTVCETDYFTVNLTHHTFSINTEKFAVGEWLSLTNDGYLAFYGSAEKFYLIEMLPPAIQAIKEGYRVDISELEKFLENTGSRTFKDENSKFSNFKIVRDYLIKLINCRR